MIKRILSITLGLILVAIGLIGILIPVMPGWTPLAVGILLLSPHHGKKFMAWLKSKRKKKK